MAYLYEQLYHPLNHQGEPAGNHSLRMLFAAAVLGIAATTAYVVETTAPEYGAANITHLANKVAKSEAPFSYTGIKEKAARYEILDALDITIFKEQVSFFNESDAAFLHTVDAGNAKAVREAIKSGDAELLSRTGNLAMVQAAWNGDFDTIKVLAEGGVDANEAYVMKGYSSGTVTRQPLKVAIDRGLPKTVTLLLDLKADPNKREDGANSSFMEAVNKKYNGLDMMEALVSAGANNLDARVSPNGHDALYFASTNFTATPEKIAYILDHLPDPAAAVNQRYDGYSSLYDAQVQGTPLLLAAINKGGVHEEGIPSSVKVLLDRGADITAKDEHGLTALHYAAVLDQLDLVKRLVKMGMDPQQKTNAGSTALDLAKNAFPHPIDTIGYLKSLQHVKTAHNPRFKI